jgi:AcrR family transcriptional regulator
LPRPAQPGASRQPREGRPRLSRDAIVAVAVELIEREGEQAVSMRRLAAELDTAAMSLYTYVPSKAALLDAVAEYILDRMELPVDRSVDWCDQVRVLVRSFRDCARRYPRSMNVVLTRQLSSSAGLRPIELALATARSAGFDGAQAVRIVRAFVAYTLGTMTSELARAHQHAQAEVTNERDLADRLDPGQFPNVRSLAGPLLEVDDDADFEFGLELLVRSVGSLPGDGI